MSTEAVLLSDRIVMMTNGPKATVGEILDIDLPRPRNRLELADDPHYNHLRHDVFAFPRENNARWKISLQHAKRKMKAVRMPHRHD